MKNIFTRLTLPVACLLLSLTSCDKKEAPEGVDPPVAKLVEPVTYSGEKAIEVREKTIIELLAIKKGVKRAIREHPENLSIDKLINELESLRPKLAMIHRETGKLPKKEQMVIYGNLAVASNQLEKGLSELLAASPGNDELAVQIANIRESLSPIPLGSLLGAR